MAEWLPIIGTLSGVLVGGGISLLLHRSTNKHARDMAELKQAEERARWAAELHLARLQTFYGSIEKLISCAQEFRIQQAWASKGQPKVPDWVPEYQIARGAIEDALNAASSEISMLDDDLQEQFASSARNYSNWFIAEDAEAGVQCLVQLESDLLTFKKLLARRYRSIFLTRKSGSDIEIGGTSGR